MARSAFEIETGGVDLSDAATTRIRVVWTMDEKRHLDRCARDFNVHGDRLLFRCGHATCPDSVIRMHRDGTAPTGAVLRCGCTDRVFSPSA